MTPAGFPHSDIPGSKCICHFPRLIAAYHVLHRLLVPRHPPCALSNLTGHPSVLAFATYPFSPIRLSKTRLDLSESRCMQHRFECCMRKSDGDDPSSCRRSRAGNGDPSHSLLLAGGDSGDRTRNLRLAKPALSQLSYIPWIVAPSRPLRCEAAERS